MLVLFIGFGFAGYVLAEYSKNLAGKNKNPVIMLAKSNYELVQVTFPPAAINAFMSGH